MRQRSSKTVAISRLIALTLVFSGIPCLAVADPPGVETNTAHYDLYVEGMDPAVAGSTAEALYARLRDFFGAEPHDRLRVKIFATRERMRAALVADGDNLTTDFYRRGVFSRVNGTAYATPGTTDLGIRSVLLHECTHQYQAMIRSSRFGSRSGYYNEGLADYFQQEVQGRLEPETDRSVLASPDLPAGALEDFDRRHRRSFRLLAVDPDYPKTSIDYCGAWGLVAFLLETRRVEYNKWSADLELSVKPEVAWADAFGDARDAALSREYLQWLKARQQPWTVLKGHWRAKDTRTIEASAGEGTCLCVLKLPIRMLSANVERSAAGTGGAGFVFDYISPTQFRSLWVTMDGQIRRADREGDQWTHYAALGKVADFHQFRISLNGSADQTNIIIDGKVVAIEPGSLSGECGLIVVDGDAAFRSIEYRN